MDEVRPKETILVVDDRLSTIDILKPVLENKGYGVWVATSGEAAVEIANREATDLILLDVIMPDMDGYETCRLLKAGRKTREIPVIFMTALSGTKDKITGFNSGGVDYLTKPIEIEEVLARVRIHLDLHWMHKELEARNIKLSEEIAERKSAQDALKKIQTRHTILLNNLPNTVFKGYEDWSVDFYDRKFEAMTGYPKEKFDSREMKIIDIVVKEDIEGMKEKFSRALEADKSYVREFRVRTSSGDILWLQDGGQIICDENGKIDFVIGAFLNITEQKQAEEELRKSEERYRSLVDHIGIGVALISPNMEILALNTRMQEWFPGVDAREKPICYLSFGYPSRKQICANCPIRETLQDGKVHEAITETSGQNGIVNFRIISSPIKNEKGDVTAAIEMVEDITKRIQGEQKLQVYQDRLRSLVSELTLTEEREKRRLAVDLHDSIGQALALSKIKIDIAGKKTASTDLAQDLSEIRELINQAIQQTRSLTFELSPPILYQFGLESAIEYLIERIQERHDIRIAFSHDRQPEPLNENLRVLLFRATQELLVNVIRHSHSPTARVRSCRKDGRIRIVVEDDGVGFEKSKIDFQSNRPEKFGLFSIKERVHHLGGKIDIESQPGAGTKVSLIVPISDVREDQ